MGEFSETEYEKYRDLVITKGSEAEKIKMALWTLLGDWPEQEERAFELLKMHRPEIAETIMRVE